MKEKLYFDIIHYAKRQMTWLKKNKEIIWLKDYADIEKEVKKFLK
jgi:tRNA A37 N6-isopentenylltransferase MiaA